MLKLKILNSKEKKQINQLIERQWGFTEKLDYVYLMNRRNRVFFITRDIETFDMENARIDSAGAYIGEILHDEMRLSIEGSQLIGINATKNIVELDDIQARLWLKGNNLELLAEDVGVDEGAFVIMRNGKDFIGCGKAKGGMIMNYVPKTRRILAKD